MTLKKRINKIIALVLVVITISTPLSNMVYAIDCINNINYNKNTVYKSDNEIINYDCKIDKQINEPIIKDLTKSPYYNNMEYYNNNNSRSILPFLFSKYALKAVWKSGIIQKFMKWTMSVIAGAFVSELAINGLPKVNTKKDIVGYGYIESGNHVKTAQILLREHGYKIDTDGYYGPKTESAVKSFQRKYGLKVDGYIGPDTWNKLINKVPR